MPIPAAAIAGAAALAGSATTAISQGSINRKNRKFQQKMFDKTNAYNTPLEQRKRLEAAGLNPNLIYGSSPSGAAGEASQPAQPDQKATDFTAAGQAVGQGLAQMYDIKTTKANLEIAKAREENIKQDTINKGIEAVNQSIKSASGSLDYRTKRNLYETTVKTAEERLRNLSAQTGYTLNKNSREQMITDQTVQNLRTQGRILKEDALMKKIDNELYTKYKIRPQDPIYFRIMGEILEQLNVKFKP